MKKRSGHAKTPWLVLEEPRSMGRRIRFWRLVHDWTQTRLASEAALHGKIVGGLTKSFISLVEDDRTTPSVQSLQGIAAALGVTLDYLITGDTSRRRATPKIDLRPIFRRARERQADAIDAELRRLEGQHAGDLRRDVTPGAPPRERVRALPRAADMR